MKSVSVSRRYATALMLIGKEDGKSDAYRRELDGIVQFFDANPEFEQTISNPLYDKNDRKNVLIAVLDKGKLSKVMKSFLVLLFVKSRIGFIREVSEFYQSLADELKGVVHATLVSATKLSEDSVEKIKAGLAKRIGKDIVLDVEQDPTLLGGVVTRIGDLVLDGSVKTQLLNMRETLKRGESA
ncbi:MAG: ATP synthase F1 subunit delta [Desulfobacterium sp.]|jgi:F-type H+-transporting ATPase subunit delta|nr:ATP synthase F1 subunit delta [Desulfobacterium sp.]